VPVGAAVGVGGSVFEQAGKLGPAQFQPLDAVGAQRVVEQARIVQQVVDRFDRADRFEEIGGLLLRRLGLRQRAAAGGAGDIVVHRAVAGGVPGSGLLAMGDEVEHLRELGITLVGQLVGEAVRVGDAFRQHLLHEALGIGHVGKAKRLHRIVEQPRVGEEVVD
jgi:hypothetical protein